MPLLSFAESKALLDKYCLPLVQTVATRSEKELFVKFAEMPKPVVLKASGPGVMHKTEKGLVFLNISFRDQLEDAIAHIRSAAGSPDFQFLMQQQAKGAELIIGAKVDASFGPVVLFGTGGIYAELLDDVSVRAAPITDKDASEMLLETKASKFLSGFRSMSMSKEKMAFLLVQASRLIAENPRVREVDFNPVIASADNAVIVDARIIVE